MALNTYDWIIGLITIFMCMSAFGNGANDVANSYATSVAARTLTMLQVGFLSVVTEFVGAVALGDNVTDTIKNGIINIERFQTPDRPGVLMLAMLCAECGSACWLILATKLGFPVSTTQTIVGALIGVGFATQAEITWEWTDGSVSQIAASWGVAPFIAAAFAAIVFGVVKYAVLERAEPLKWGMRLIPWFLAFTASILALFITIEAPTAPSLEEFGAGKAAGIILGVFFGVLLIAYVFFLPYFHRRLILDDARVKWYHIPLGPTLWRDDPWIYFPADPSGVVVIDYYRNASLLGATNVETDHQSSTADSDKGSDGGEVEKGPTTESTSKTYSPPVTTVNTTTKEGESGPIRIVEPREIFLKPTDGLPIANPKRLWAWAKFLFLRGIYQDCVSHSDPRVQKTHRLAVRYDNKTEHLWTYCQVASAMLMSIAHGSNDVANAIGPWAATYATWRTEMVNTEAATPKWILAVAGLLLGAGFWFFGYHIIRALGNRITQMSPTRGFACELGAAITVLLASRLSLPVSTTQCLAGATFGVAMMNYSVGAVNWRQAAFIFSGWVMTLPAAGLLSGVLMLLALNTPQF